MFALTVFWAYIAFSQYLADLVREYPGRNYLVPYRFEGTWSGSQRFCVGHFIFPFFVLLPRAGQAQPQGLDGSWRSGSWLSIHRLVLAGYADLRSRGGSRFTGSISLVCGRRSAMGLVFWSRMRAHALIPIGDPRFEQALQFQNAYEGA